MYWWRRKTEHCERNSKSHFYKGDSILIVEEMFLERISIVCISCGGSKKYQRDKSWRSFSIARVWICIPRNTRIATNEGDIFLNWFSARIFPGVKITLQNEHTRVKRIKNAVVGIVEEMVHTSKCFTMGSTNTLFQKEEWNFEVVYWLLTVE